jgi:hypothetical protein
MRTDLSYTRIGAVGYCFGGKYVPRWMAAGKGIDVGFIAHPSGLERAEIEGVAGPISIAAGGMFTLCFFDYLVLYSLVSMSSLSRIIVSLRFFMRAIPTHLLPHFQYLPFLVFTPVSPLPSFLYLFLLLHDHPPPIPTLPPSLLPLPLSPATPTHQPTRQNSTHRSTSPIGAPRRTS